MKLKENKDIIETLIEFLNDYSIKSSLDPKNSFEIFKKGLNIPSDRIIVKYKDFINSKNGNIK